MDLVTISLLLTGSLVAFSLLLFIILQTRHCLYELVSNWLHKKTETKRKNKYLPLNISDIKEKRLNSKIATHLEKKAQYSVLLRDYLYTSHKISKQLSSTSVETSGRVGNVDEVNQAHHISVQNKVTNPVYQDKADIFCKAPQKQLRYPRINYIEDNKTEVIIHCTECQNRSQEKDE